MKEANAGPVASVCRHFQIWTRGCGTIDIMSFPTEEEQTVPTRAKASTSWNVPRFAKSRRSDKALEETKLPVFRKALP